MSGPEQVDPMTQLARLWTQVRDEFPDGLLLRGSEAHVVKVCEHEFDDQDDDGPYTVWNFSTHRDPE